MGAKIEPVPGEVTVGTKKAIGTILYDGAGNQITAFGGSGGTSHSDDAAFSIGSASSITPIGALADETSPDAVDEGDVGVPRMTLDRKLLTRIVGATDANRADVDASGNLQVDIAADSVGIGGGIQYTEGDIDATISGNALLMEVSGDVLRPVPGSVAGGVLVDLGTNNDVTVTGSVTANAGTNLNTSALALEAGGNLAGVRTAVEIIDDWDESDRAKVNPIVGQAGIAAGAGAVGVTVPRVTLASDDPAVAALQIIDDWDETDRAKVNPIVGQAGIAAGAGAVGVTVPRVTLASDDPAVTALQLLDNSVDGNYLNVNLNAAGADVAVGAGAVGVTVPRVTLASDDPAVTALQLLDNSVDGNYLNVNLNAAGADITVGNGAVVAGTTPRVTIASDSPDVTALQLLDNSVDGNYLNVNLNAAGTDIAVNSGAADAQTLRVIHATNDPVTTAIQIMDDWDNGLSDGASVSGDVAHDTADAGEPVKIGAKAIEHLDTVTLVAAADRTDLYADRDGVLITKPYTPLHTLVSFHISNADGNEDAVTGLGAVASTYNYITAIVVHNSNASTNGYVKLTDGSGGTVFAVFPAPATGGCVINFQPPLKQPTVATALYVNTSAAIGTVYITIVGFQSKAG